MKFYLKKRETIEHGIQRINRELRERVHSILHDESLDADTAVHELRKCVKKLRAVLRLSQPAKNRKLRKKADRKLRDFARRIGNTRDSAVMVSTYDSLISHYSPFLSSNDMLPVHQALQNRHVLAMACFHETSATHELEADFSRVERLLKRTGKVSMSRQMLIDGVRTVYSQGRKLSRALVKDPTTDNSHELRRQAKYLWYQLTLLKKQLPDQVKPVIRELDELGELLGQDNDISVLVETLQANPELTCNRIRMELIGSLAETRRIVLLSRALRLAARIYRQKSRRFIHKLVSP